MNYPSDYIIGGWPVRIHFDTPKSSPGTGPFDVFRVEERFSETPKLTLHMIADRVEITSPDRAEFLTEFLSEETVCRFYRYAGGWLLTMERKGEDILFMDMRSDGEGHLNAYTNGGRSHMVMSLRFALWMAYGISVLDSLTVPVHSSAALYKGKALMCLGESGTGKSTHTRLWRENIPGAQLLNDDSPMVRVEGDRVLAYGSPWSGKTPCYKNMRVPVAAFVRLEQAPFNEIQRLKGISALGALLPSCPPTFAFDEKLEDGIMNFLSEVLKRVPVYYLKCLPDADAAFLVRDTLEKDGVL